ncbi:MAG: TolA-binding protein [Oleispira sp.]|jgi:TolA-binding protein
MNFRLLGLTLVVLITTGCSIATPFVAAGAGGHAIGRYEENIKVRGAAALKEEPDLLTFSVQAIARNNIKEAVATYTKGLNSEGYSDNVKSLALYQIGLLYMNPYAEQRNDTEALKYFNQHTQQYPDSRLRKKIEAKIALIQQRKTSTSQLTAKELLSLADRKELLEQSNIPFDAELTPMSERAITGDRVSDAESVYLILYENKASSEAMRAKALYQIGLIYMSEYNSHGDNAKALNYFRKITQEFPDSPVAKKASKRMSQVINRQ